MLAVMKHAPSPAAAGLAVVAGALLAAAGARAGEVAPAPATLADTGLYADGDAGPGGARVRADNLPFAPQYPLWSDGAAKRRWIHLPPGAAIDASGPAAWVFPPGTRLWKEFSVRGRRIETRFIERLADGRWRFAAYRWNADGTAATLVPARGAAGDVELAPGVRYQFPAEGDCRACHEGRATPVLGFTALQLSPDRDPRAPHAEPPPAGAIDLPAAVARGMIRGLPAALLARPPRIAARTPTARAALGYLDANCGICHNAGGPLAGLELDLDAGAGDNAPAVLASTLARPSLWQPPGATAPLARLAPRRPEHSAIAARMRARDPATRMPPLGTQVADQAALDLVTRWIREQAP
jgi:hypothetical protein